MTTTQAVLQYEIKEKPIDGVPVIVVAAGNFTRMNGINKQLMELCGIPVIIRTLMAFQRCDDISDIILVVRADDVFELQMLTEKYKITKLTDIVCGGSSRQESVMNGLSRVAKEQKCVLIHDGARPLVDSNIIHSVVTALKDNHGAIPAVKSKDTIKQVDEHGVVVKTIPRDNLVLVQTPQGVRTEEYRKAVEQSGDEICEFTDDASLMEAAGYKVAVVEGNYRNIKITTREDIALAEVYLKEETE